MFASVTVAVKLTALPAVVGVPLNTPELAFSPSPAGTVPAVVHANGAVPPDVAMVCVYTRPFVAPGSGDVGPVIVNAPFTVNVSVLVAVTPLPSVTVKVTLVVVPVGVPLNTPAVLRFNPVGRFDAVQL